MTPISLVGIGFLLSGKASLDAAKELVRDFIHLDATRNIAGQLSRQRTPRALRAIGQAFATESGGYLTRNHMEIWADFAERALGITREEMFRWTPPTATIASGYVTSWFLVHSSPEEAIAAFHLGPPPGVRERMGKAALGLGQGGVAGEGLIQPVAARARHPLTAAFERLGGAFETLARQRGRHEAVAGCPADLKTLGPGTVDQKLQASGALAEHGA